MNKIIEDLNWRYACKKFDANKKLSDKQLETVLEALRLTPSSYGIQPWKFVLVEDISLREKLVAASWGQEQVKDASHLLVLCAPLNVDEELMQNYIDDMAKTRNQAKEELDGFKGMIMKLTERDTEKNKAWANNQVYIALGNLMTVCAHLKIDCCPMEGFKPSQYDEILGLKERGLRSVLVAPIGFRDSDDKYIAIPKVRFSQDQLVIKI